MGKAMGARSIYQQKPWSEYLIPRRNPSAPPKLSQPPNIFCDTPLLQACLGGSHVPGLWAKCGNFWSPKMIKSWFQCLHEPSKALPPLHDPLKSPLLALWLRGYVCFATFNPYHHKDHRVLNHHIFKFCCPMVWPVPCPSPSKCSFLPFGPIVPAFFAM